MTSANYCVCANEIYVPALLGKSVHIGISLPRQDLGSAQARSWLARKMFSHVSTCATTCRKAKCGRVSA